MTKFLKIKKYFATILAIFALFFIGTEVFAAEIFFESENQKIKTNEQFEVGFFLNTENEYINAIEGKIIFPTNILELKEIRNGNSIINFWIEEPRAEFSSPIIFSGIIPGGYLNKKGLIFSMIFQSKKEGESVLEISDARVLLNDGKGTEVSLLTSDFQVLISKQVINSHLSVSEIRDTNPPELFIPEIARDSSIFDGKWFLVFATQDKNSGIDYYEISEGKEPFRIAQSPYLLKNQKLNEDIRVRAIDKAGNIRTEIIPAEKTEKKDKFKEILFFSVLLLSTIILVIFARYLYNKNRKAI